MSSLRARRVLSSCACAAAILCAAGSASAQQFSSIKAFGDSYVDTGNLWKLLPPGSQLPLYPTGRFSGGTNYVDTLSGLQGVPAFNFAIGGAKAGTTNTVAPGLPGFTQEWAGYLAGGGAFLPSDLLVLNIGGNDARQYYQTGGSAAGVPAAAATTAAQAMAGVNALVGAGARNILFTVGDVGALPEATGNPAAAIGTAFSQTYNLQMQAQLGLLAAAGVRVEYVDIGMLGAQIRSAPALYGVANSGACPVACIGNPALQSQYLFYVDGIHLTSTGFAIMGEYVNNRLNAPLALGSQGDIGMIATTSFLSNMFGRLDLFNAQSGPGAASQALAYADPTHIKGPLSNVPAAAPASPLSAYIQVNGGLGSRKANGAGNGYDWDSVGGTIGIDYRIGANALIGAAFNYANPSVRQYMGAGRSDVDAYQFGLYGAWAGPNLFAQGVLSFGVLKYANARPGVVNQLTSSPGGSTFAAAFKTGYLFDVAPRVKLGPIVGLTYARATVDAYAESGDPVLNLAPGQQKVEALVGSAGAQLRYGLQLAGRNVDTFLNLTAEEDFRGNGRSFQYSATSAPLIVNTWTIPGSRAVYGRVAFGAATPIWSNVSMSFNISQTIGRKGGDDFTGSGGLKFTF
ncbi:MAG: autotransporter domain-containing protein [Hyphomicrobiales bacterium]|nr:autotransporter domain-containing protein [Hyphomicrobiales bacterium]